MGMSSFSHCFSRTPALSTLLAPLQVQAELFGPAAPAPGNPLGEPIKVKSISRRSASKRRAAGPTATRQGETTAGVTLKCNNTPYNAALNSHLNARRIGKNGVVADARIPPQSKPSLSRLKIVRQFEPDASACCAGRMTISGRMADVCAELDRMAQREAASSCH